MSEAERHEPTDAEPRLVGLLAAAVAGGVAVALLAGWAILGAGRPRAAGAAADPAASFTHGPEERTGVAGEWPAIEAETRARLETYGWIDRPAGVVRIPIEQAMARLAAPPLPRP